MRPLSLLALSLFASTLCSAPVPKEKEKTRDEDAILGTWAIEKFDSGGAPNGPSPEEIANIKFIFKKDGKLAMTGGPNGEERDAEYKLDPAAKLKTIDMTLDGRTALGLYELDGDILKLCVAEGDNAARPEQFKADGKRISVVTFKRLKDEKKAK